ncbi:MAG TPA: CDP-diacylglycerol--serine O-phosphatidyltransferase [Gammaproteobacteria bacterium]|jgi:CDP-diacylglycerol--serine O-phosphatidyltransferase|nr:CDP-diacylglycerol--serine O-phosphatidyltransferase [Gammaproteobacteria bacterium]
MNQLPNTTQAQNKPPEKIFQQRGIYLLPNLLTTAALFAGFYAIVAAMQSHFEIAAIAIFVAMVADGLDGRVARMTNTQTAFGAQYDSLSDMVAFGVAPALVMFNWSIFSLGKLGWLAAFLYTAATALRLARFNTQVPDKRYFQGLPCPAAAGVLASTVWMGSAFASKGTLFAIPLALFTILIATLMVSTIRYSSFKTIDFKGRVPFFTIVTAVFLIAAIALEPAEMLFSLFLIYALAGPVLTLWQLHKVRKHKAEHRTHHSHKGHQL